MKKNWSSFIGKSNNEGQIEKKINLKKNKNLQQAKFMARLWGWDNPVQKKLKKTIEVNSQAN
jgi:hypothetical protein